jgi:hypothetical protein
MAILQKQLSLDLIRRLAKIPVVDLAVKVNKEPGKGLSANDFTVEAKNKLDSLVPGQGGGSGNIDGGRANEVYENMLVINGGGAV